MQEKIHLRKFDKSDSFLKLASIYCTLAIFCVISIYPILNIISISLRPSTSAFLDSLDLIPQNATLSNYFFVFKKYPVLQWIKNSFLASVVSTIVGVSISISAGYAFSRFRFRGRRLGLMMVFLTKMFPATMMLLPLYLMLIFIGLNNTFTGLIIIYISKSIPFNVWIMKGYFDTIPRALEESAYIDGASVWKTFYKIILPLAKPAIALASIFSFMMSWSEYIVARTVLTESEKITLPVGLVNMQGEWSTDWGMYSAAALVTTIPVVIIFVMLSKYLVGGLSAGGVKE